MLQVRLASGGLSTCVIKSFEMGSEKFAGSAVDLVWLDEEPADYGLYTECLTRVLSTGGRVFVTFTPLLGHSLLVDHFQTGGAGVFMWGLSLGESRPLHEGGKGPELVSHHGPGR